MRLAQPLCYHSKSEKKAQIHICILEISPIALFAIFPGLVGGRLDGGGMRAVAAAAAVVVIDGMMGDVEVVGSCYVIVLMIGLMMSSSGGGQLVVPMDVRRSARHN